MALDIRSLHPSKYTVSPTSLFDSYRVQLKEKIARKELLQEMLMNKAPCAQFNMDTSSIKSDCLSVALDGSMSSSESLKSPEVEYIDNTDVAAIDSIERKTYNKLCISDDGKTTGSICKRDILAEMETCDRIVDVDENSMDRQLCATMACDIYKHLRASEVTKSYFSVVH
ncbi:hypothetical protein POM88_009680 [Heracleum sosnowskyi]|uniref:Uncharacterized protein n=1 Tax=Heracleum sosnowskyi TaxID=360622 RepID=A0AAD8J8S2_9APIA|nr:hypothetical protein POM88_009680 [Heracleum sosnowskyi]